jgi:transcriptional regulator with XRE-family HTH domain
MSHSSPPSLLGTRLRAVRELRGLSLRAAAEPAGISAAYLQKLERGVVESPSPHALHGLAEVLDTSYSDLMALAGYPVPEPVGEARVPVLIASERSSEPLNDDEARQLTDYLAFLRHQRRHDEPR